VTFVGTFEHTLDKKGRLVLPSKFRRQLPDLAYLSPGRGECLALWPEDNFNQMLDRMTESARSGVSDQQVVRAFTAASTMVSPDTQGRVLLTESLLNFANLAGAVVLVGARDHIEIWDREAWKTQSLAADQLMLAALEGGVGI
jgi:MraZ protein